MAVVALRPVLKRNTAHCIQTLYVLKHRLIFSHLFWHYSVMRLKKPLGSLRTHFVVFHCPCRPCLPVDTACLRHLERKVAGISVYKSCVIFCIFTVFKGSVPFRQSFKNTAPHFNGKQIVKLVVLRKQSGKSP